MIFVVITLDDWSTADVLMKAWDIRKRPRLRENREYIIFITCYIELNCSDDLMLKASRK